MTSMEQIELISVEARKRGMKYGEYVEKYGHTLPKPKPKKYKEHEWYEGMDHKSYEPRKKIELICQNPECGAPFLSTRDDVKFCPVCRKEKHRELMRKRNRQRRKEAKEK